MNDGCKEFINNMGVLCETWMVTYEKFVEMGLNHDAALEHTKGLMAAIMTTSRNNGDSNGT